MEGERLNSEKDFYDNRTASSGHMTCILFSIIRNSLDNFPLSSRGYNYLRISWVRSSFILQDLCEGGAWPRWGKTGQEPFPRVDR